MAQHLSMPIGSSRCLPLIVRVLAATLAAGLPMVAEAHWPIDPAAIEEHHPTGHVGDHDDLTWPPQPRGITNVIPLGDSVAAARAASTLERRTADKESIALARADVRKALGTRFVRVAIAEDEDKSGAAPTSRIEYFSHSKNATVEVTMDGDRVLTVTRTRPSTYQPEITDTEAAEAEALARKYFAKIGKDRVSTLEGFSILAYKPQGSRLFQHAHALRLVPSQQRRAAGVRRLGRPDAAARVARAGGTAMRSAGTPGGRRQWSCGRCWCSLRR